MTYDYFSPNNAQQELAWELFQQTEHLPLICPHGHVDPRLFADRDYRFGSPVDLLIIPDHYVFRMLYSHGVPLDALAIPRRDGEPTETNHRKVWQIFADNFYLFRATPTGIWLRDELASIFGITEKVNRDNAQDIYTAIAEKLSSSDFQPRRLYEQFNIEVLATTDKATDPLTQHQIIHESGWSGRIIPTFRPDALINLDTKTWKQEISQLTQVSGVDVHNYVSFITALEERRAYFKSMGATATDHAALSAWTERLSDTEAEAIFQKALKDNITTEDAKRFTGHMLIEMARMSVEDGLVMQLHIGAYRNHNPLIFEQFGWDMGADMPVASEFTRNLKPLLDKFGNHPELTIILFTLDETTFSRELAPLSGHYPCLKLGPPWWFFDSLNGMARYFDLVIETAGLYNTAGFNDDTRAFLSIPARHNVWRRASADWLANLVLRRIIDEEDAVSMMRDMAYGLAKSAYRLD